MTETSIPRERSLVTQPQIGEAGKHTNVNKAERVVSGIAGGLLAMRALRHPSKLSIPLGLVGGALLHRGTTGKCYVYKSLGIDSEHGTSVRRHITRAVTIQRPVEEVYSYWRELSNLPTFMKHLVSVTELDNRRSHWVAKGPAKTKVAWDAEIMREEENRLVAWRSLPDSKVINSGEVRFVPIRGGGTEVHVTLDYAPPAGKAGPVLAKLFGEEPNIQIRDDLRRFKQILETGEISTNAPRSGH